MVRAHAFAPSAFPRQSKAEAQQQQLSNTILHSNAFSHISVAPNLRKLQATATLPSILIFGMMRAHCAFGF